MKRSLPLFAALAAASLSGAPVVPGEFTDPTNLRASMEARPVSWWVAPERLRFPYVSTYYAEPTATTEDAVRIPFYVTDWDHSKVRFHDGSFRFAVHCRWIGPDGKAHGKVRRGVPSGDGAFDLGRLPAGEYSACVWAVDAKGLESHRVWRAFRVVGPKGRAVPKSKTFRATADDLAAYGVRGGGDLGRKVLVDVPDPPEKVKPDEATRLALEALDRYAAAHPPAPRKGAPGYTVLIAAKDGKPVVGSWRKSRVVFDAGYDTNAVEQAAVATAEGLQRLLDDKAAAGFRKVVLPKGTYRVSAMRKIVLPDGMTLDLGGATLKQNAFTGCHSVGVSIEGGVRDAHLVNGTIEGDYYEHDYAGSPKNSEWPMGFRIDGPCSYCSVEGVVVRDITGYGGGNGMGKGPSGFQTSFWPKPVPGEWTPGGLDPATGEVDGAEAGRATTAFLPIGTNMPAVMVTKYLGYQGVGGDSWTMTGCWYDAEKKFLSSETLFQYRAVPVPAGAKFLRFSLAAADADAAKKAGLHLADWYRPWNCAVRNCTFDRCRCVGYAASAMKDFLFEGNLFTHCGEAAARCAFDAEDGWDLMQDVTFRGNRCEDNPVNNSLLTCAGHNFVFEGNECDLFFWPRTYSPCVRDNDVGLATFNCQSRNYSGYGRFEGNRYAKGVEIASPRPYWFGWEHVLSGLDFSGETADGFRMKLGPSARLVGCRFKGRPVSFAFGSACTLEDCTATRLPSGEWRGVEMSGGRIEILSATNAFAKCAFKGVRIGPFQGGAQTFEDCTFEDCSFDGIQDRDGADVRFARCRFLGGSFSTGWWVPPSRLAFEDCEFDVRGPWWIRLAAYSVDRLSFERCRFRGSGDAPGPVLFLFDFRNQPTDDRTGRVDFRDCVFGDGIPAAVGLVKDNTTGKNQARKPMVFDFAGSSFPAGFDPMPERLAPWTVEGDVR